MTVKISPHAESLFHGILAQIAAALYIEDAYRWHDKILAVVGQLADFPEIGTVIPAECFAAVPDNAGRIMPSGNFSSSRRHSARSLSLFALSSA